MRDLTPNPLSQEGEGAKKPDFMAFPLDPSPLSLLGEGVGGEVSQEGSILRGRGLSPPTGRCSESPFGNACKRRGWGAGAGPGPPQPAPDPPQPGHHPEGRPEGAWPYGHRRGRQRRDLSHSRGSRTPQSTIGASPAGHAVSARADRDEQGGGGRRPRGLDGAVRSGVAASARATRYAPGGECSDRKGRRVRTGFEIGGGVFDARRAKALGHCAKARRAPAAQGATSSTRGPFEPMGRDLRRRDRP